MLNGSLSLMPRKKREVLVLFLFIGNDKSGRRYKRNAREPLFFILD